MWLALKSLAWTILLPGMVAGYIPWHYFDVREARIDLTNPRHLVALLLFGLGASLLLACIWEFARRGRGTLSPVNPTKELVVSALYQYVRNPMYLSVALMLAGELLLAPSRDFLVYAAGIFLLFNLAVLLYEEPILRRKFGDSYRRYTERVPRWIPRIPRGTRREP